MTRTEESRRNWHFCGQVFDHSNSEQVHDVDRFEVSHVGNLSALVVFLKEVHHENCEVLALVCGRGVLSLLAILNCENRAHADNDLYLGSNYNPGGFYTFNGSSPGGGGSIGQSSTPPSSLNGVTLPWVYCIDIPDDVGVPSDYPKTTVTTYGAAIYGPGSSFANGGLVSVPGAQMIANLLGTFAADANTGSADEQTLKQDGLQAAIWQTIYGAGSGSTGFVVTDAAVATQMNTDRGQCKDELD